MSYSGHIRLLGTAAGFLFATAAVLIAGCSRQGMNAAVLPADEFREQSAAGGPFRARYSGRLRVDCYGDIVCDWSLHGRGYGSFIHTSTVRDGSSSDCEKGITWYDHLTIDSTGEPADKLYITATGDPATCLRHMALRGNYTVTGGSGKFAHAGGSGSVTMHLEGNTFESRLSGTLTF